MALSAYRQQLGAEIDAYSWPVPALMSNGASCVERRNPAAVASPIVLSTIMNQPPASAEQPLNFVVPSANVSQFKQQQLLLAVNAALANPAATLEALAKTSLQSEAAIGSSNNPWRSAPASMPPPSLSSSVPSPAVSRTLLDQLHQSPPSHASQLQMPFDRKNDNSIAAASSPLIALGLYRSEAGKQNAAPTKPKAVPATASATVALLSGDSSPSPSSHLDKLRLAVISKHKDIRWMSIFKKLTNPKFFSKLQKVLAEQKLEMQTIATMDLEEIRRLWRVTHRRWHSSHRCQLQKGARQMDKMAAMPSSVGGGDYYRAMPTVR